MVPGRKPRKTPLRPREGSNFWPGLPGGEPKLEYQRYEVGRGQVVGHGVFHVGKVVTHHRLVEVESFLHVCKNEMHTAKT